MAKKQAKAYAGDPGDEHLETVVVKTPVTEAPPVNVRAEPKKRIINDWEIKDRTYVLSSDRRPLSFMIGVRNLRWFDEVAGYEREVQYAENQNTVFVDEFKGVVRPGRVIFRAGVLHVPKNKVILQKIMSIYHPQAGKTWKEVKPQVEAADDLEIINWQLDAMIAARNMDINMAEAIMRVENGSRVSSMSSKELKRDLLIFAKSKPGLFLELMNDENIHLRNVGIKAVEMGILAISSDQRTVNYAANGRRLLNVPFEEHPYSALAAWFKTDEGMEALISIEKQMK